MNAIKGRVSESGRISLPAEVRRAVGLERGGDVVIELEGRDIRIRTIEEVVARAQGLTKRLFADSSEASVDDFLANRRQEWGEG